MLGILTLDTGFPRIRGDVGCPETFDFPVRIRAIGGASVEDVVHRREDALVPEFAAAGRALVEQGCAGIATTCGFLARWQVALTDRIPVPVLTSALLQVPLVARLLPRGRRVGIVTYSAGDLTLDALQAAGVDPRTPIEGVDPAGHFAQTIRHGARELDRRQMAEDVCAAARRLVGTHRDVGALVLECANMPPYRDAVEQAVGVPVFDAAQLVAWFHAGLAGTVPRYGRRDLW